MKSDPHNMLIGHTVAMQKLLRRIADAPSVTAEASINANMASSLIQYLERLLRTSRVTREGTLKRTKE